MYSQNVDQLANYISEHALKIVNYREQASSLKDLLTQLNERRAVLTHDSEVATRCINRCRMIVNYMPELAAQMDESITKLREKKINLDREAGLTNADLIKTSTTNNHLYNTISRTQLLIETTQKVLTEIKGREDDRKEKSVNSVLFRRLPQDVLNLIGSYLPYPILFQVWEKRFKPIHRVMTKLRPLGVMALFRKLIKSPVILSTFPVAKARGHRHQSFMSDFRTDNAKLLNLIYDMKVHCPKEVISLYKEIVILMKNPRRKYERKNV